MEHPRRAGTKRETPGIFAFRDGLELGLTPGAMRSRRFDAPTRGLRRVPGGTVPQLEVLRAYSALDGGTYLSHRSAALAWGMWIPGGNAALPIHVTRVRGSGGHSRRPNVIGHVAPLLERDRRVEHGVALTSPAWTWADLAGTGLGLGDLVAAGNSLLQPALGPPRPSGVVGSHPLSGLAEIDDVLERRRSVPGVRLAREARELLTPWFHSPMESRLRALLVEAGIDDLEVNVRLDFPDGWTVMPDLVIRWARIAIEYDGEHHRVDRVQYERDIDRDARLRERGWTVLKVTASVFTPAGRDKFLGRLRRELLRAEAA